VGENEQLNPKALAFTLKCERAFFSLVAEGNAREARVWGPIVDALIANDPLLAIRLASKHGLQRSTIRAISQAFGLTT
jgi:hypothetical protein